MTAFITYRNTWSIYLLKSLISSLSVALITLAPIPVSRAQSASNAELRTSKSASERIQILCTESDKAVARSLQTHFQNGIERIEKYFDRPFKNPFQIELLPDRSTFDAYFERRWKIPKTEAWMVASGVADHIVILSPRVWKTQSVEHNPNDDDHIRELVAHELVHVYHGQMNPRPDFDGMDDFGWFIEGLAVFVSGQLDRSHHSDAREAIESEKAPKRLADAWSGRYRYGVSGSLVEFIEKKYGKDVIMNLMTVVHSDEALKLLKTTEGDFLDAWKEYVAKRR